MTVPWDPLQPYLVKPFQLLISLLILRRARTSLHSSVEKSRQTAGSLGPVGYAELGLALFDDMIVTRGADFVWSIE